MMQGKVITFFIIVFAIVFADIKPVMGQRNAPVELKLFQEQPLPSIEINIRAAYEAKRRADEREALYQQQLMREARERAQAKADQIVKEAEAAEQALRQTLETEAAKVAEASEVSEEEALAAKKETEAKRKQEAKERALELKAEMERKEEARVAQQAKEQALLKAKEAETKKIAEEEAKKAAIAKEEKARKQAEIENKKKKAAKQDVAIKQKSAEKQPVEQQAKGEQKLGEDKPKEIVIDNNTAELNKKSAKKLKDITDIPFKKTPKAEQKKPSEEIKQTSIATAKPEDDKAADKAEQKETVSDIAETKENIVDAAQKEVLAGAEEQKQQESETIIEAKKVIPVPKEPPASMAKKIAEEEVKKVAGDNTSLPVPASMQQKIATAAAIEGNPVAKKESEPVEAEVQEDIVLAEAEESKGEAGWFDKATSWFSSEETIEEEPIQKTIEKEIIPSSSPEPKLAAIPRTPKLFEQEIEKVIDVSEVEADTAVPVVIEIPPPPPGGDALSIASMFEANDRDVQMPKILKQKQEEPSTMAFKPSPEPENIPVAMNDNSNDVVAGNSPQSLLPSALNAINAAAGGTSSAAQQQQQIASLPTQPQTSTSSPGVLVSVNFAQDATDLPANAEKKLRDVIQQLKTDPMKRLSIIGYASNPDDRVSTARRISLKRALSIRKHMIDEGVESIRINVQAMGNNNKNGGEQDRVDLFFIGEKSS